MKRDPVSPLSSVTVAYCQICRKLWQSWSRLKQHYQGDHRLKRIFPCKERLCECVFLAEKQLLRHQQLLHKLPKCPICPKVFPNSLALKQHLNTHMAEPRKSMRQADLHDLRDVTERYLRKLRRRLSSSHLDCKAALPASLKEVLLQRSSPEDSGTSLALLSFILHASELATQPIRADMSPALATSEQTPAPSFPPISKAPVFMTERIDEVVHSEATSPQSHGYSTWDMWAGLQEEEMACPWEDCKEQFSMHEDLLAHLRSAHCA